MQDRGANNRHDGIVIEGVCIYSGNGFSIWGVCVAVKYVSMFVLGNGFALDIFKFVPFAIVVVLSLIVIQEPVSIHVLIVFGVKVAILFMVSLAFIVTGKQIGRASCRERV